MKVFVAGSTGKTGKRIVEELVRREIEVIALVRDLEKAKGILPKSVELTVGDVLKPESIRGAIAACDLVISATGAAPSLDITGPYSVDYVGTKNLVNLAKETGIKQFVMISSLCVSRFFHPLNLFWLVLYWKKQAEMYLQDSGIPYTIVRPGGLKEENNDEQVLMKDADSLFDGSIPRQKVAEVAVESLFNVSAQNKIVEIITKPDAPSMSYEELFTKV